MDKLMIDRLETVLARYMQIQHDLEDDNVIADIKKYTALSKEARQLEETTKAYIAYKNAQKTLQEARILSHESDMELVMMAQLEEEESLNKMAELEEKLKVLLLPKDPNDDKNVIMEIRGAAGGDEGNIFAGDLFRMYSRYAEQQGYRIEINDSNETEFGGYSLISFMIVGDGAYSKFKYESGAHRVQRVPRTEAQGRIHTSTATVLVMPEVDLGDTSLKMEDVTIEVYRSSGAGGQHINKTESAVRCIHEPTGIIVACQDGRSQHANKEKALQILAAKVQDYYVSQAEEKLGQERKIKIGSGERSEKIRTYNYPQNRVTDHRIGFTIQKLDRVMEGELQEIIDALTNEEQKEKLEAEM
ncbi:MAG: peptide chain release factor 1 [Erysipelotrichaceae bacterium]|nr:peptide chain release factor 1 [Erysipelotrichaceae bacterium]